jgi:hypothetical protein
LYILEFVSLRSKFGAHGRDEYIQSVHDLYKSGNAKFFHHSGSKALLKASAIEPSPIYWPESLFLASQNVIKVIVSVLTTSTEETFLTDGSVPLLGRALYTFTLLSICARFFLSIYLIDSFSNTVVRWHECDNYQLISNRNTLRELKQRYRGDKALILYDHF